MLTLADITLAQYRIASYLQATPLEPAPGLGDAVWLKLENTNKTHSFKARGALNAVFALDDAARQRGIVTASSGNHAQALAWASQVVGAQAKILMPKHTPRRKVNGVEFYGAEAVLFGENFDETEAEARRLEQVEGRTFISAYADPDVISGAGTVGLELVAQLPQIERVIVPASGCGLISGIGIALKALRPQVEVVAVNAESSPALYNFFHDTNLPQIWDTLAEALSGGIEDGSITFALTQQVVDRVVLVSEAAIAEAMRWALLEQGWVIEGGGAVGIAAVRSGVIALDDRPTAIVVTGGNLDEATLRRILHP